MFAEPSAGLYPNLFEVIFVGFLVLFALHCQGQIICPMAVGLAFDSLSHLPKCNALSDSVLVGSETDAQPLLKGILVFPFFCHKLFGFEYDIEG